MVMIHADPVPLAVDEHGVIRVGGTRVPLETIMARYLKGDTAAEIAENFPTVGVANVHAAIAYFHRHHGEVQRYLDAAWAEEEQAYREFRSTPLGARIGAIVEREPEAPR